MGTVFIPIPSLPSLSLPPSFHCVLGVSHSGDQEHRNRIVQTFKPTPENSSFRRPQSDMNVASGCPQFSRLSVLDDPSYTKDDVIYSKFIVDTCMITCSSVSVTLRNSTALHTLQKHVGRPKIADGPMPIDLPCEPITAVYYIPISGTTLCIVIV